VSSWIYLLLAGLLLFNAAGLIFFETILEEWAWPENQLY
jgi:hypothetical protein